MNYKVGFTMQFINKFISIHKTLILSKSLFYILSYLFSICGLDIRY